MKKLAKNAAFTLIVVLGFTSCNKGPFSIIGNGPIVEKTIEIGEFNGVNLQGSFNVEIEQGTVQSVVAIGNENIIERLKKDIDNGIWKIELKNGNYKDLDLTIKIISPSIDQIAVSGSGNIKTSGFTGLSNLSATISGSGSIDGTSAFTVSNKVNSTISGSGSIDLNFTSSSCKFVISGSGSLNLAGYCESQEVIISGSGQIYGFNLNSETSDIKISASGDVETFVNKSIDVTISGSGNVYYKGNPTISTNISGSGNIYSSN